MTVARIVALSLAGTLAALVGAQAADPAPPYGAGISSGRKYGRRNSLSDGVGRRSHACLQRLQ